MMTLIAMVTREVDRALRAGKRLPPRHLCHVVDQGGDPGIHLALVVPGEDGHHEPIGFV